MFHAKTICAFICTLVWSFATPADAATLEDHGVSLVSTGVIDHVSGLRWLDANLTHGPVETLLPFLEQGWRIATLSDFNFLLSRDAVPSGTSGIFQVLPGGPNEASDFMRHLGFDVNYYPTPTYDQPWLCMDFGGTSNCSIDTPSGTPIILDENYIDSGAVSWLTYLSKVPLYYGNCHPMDECIPEGRTMLVRPVPLPGTVGLFLAAVAMFSTFARRR